MSDLSVRSILTFSVRGYPQMYTFCRSAINMVMAPASTWDGHVQQGYPYRRGTPPGPPYPILSIVDRSGHGWPQLSVLSHACRFNEAFQPKVLKLAIIHQTG